MDRRQSDNDPAIDKLRQLVDPKNANVDQTTVRVEAAALVARLKALNRHANAATRTHKQATTDARQEMDQTHLSLQNLLYEKRHLEREIEKCRQFAYVACHPTSWQVSYYADPSTRTFHYTLLKSSRNWHPRRRGLTMSLATRIS